MYPYHLYGSVPPLEAHTKYSVINTEALVHNFKVLASKTALSRKICVVKADAYSHSAQICVPALIRAGCDFFAVSCIEEAVAVRQICNDQGSNADILILGYTEPIQAKLLSQYDLIQTAISFEHAKKLSDSAVLQNCTVRIHFALDTGMNRIGIFAGSLEDCQKAVNEIELAMKLPSLKPEGMFTHFSSSDEDVSELDASKGFTYLQGERFIAVKNALEKQNIRLFCHACNSIASVRFPQYAFDGVRLGIMLYGVYPSHNCEDIGLRPVMSLSTIISHIHSISPGDKVGYGGTFTAKSNMRVATLPIGYADGLLRKYSGAYVTVITSSGSFRAEIIGRICMDQCMVDLQSIPAEVGDSVTIFGHDPHDLSKLAALADTIEYECLCLVSARVPRIIK